MRILGLMNIINITQIVILRKFHNVRQSDDGNQEEQPGLLDMQYRQDDTGHQRQGIGGRGGLFHGQILGHLWKRGTRRRGDM